MTERTDSAVPAKRTRRKRDPQGTREAILEAARQQLSQDGKEGVSVAQVAQRAGVNRGTAYQHFQTREQLIEATAAWVSDQLYEAVFGDADSAGERPVEQLSVEAITQHVAEFAMQNPEIGRVWLFELLSSRRPAKDRFWQTYLSNFERFARTELAQPGVDAEVVTVLTIAGAFLWPVMARSQARTAKEREQMAKRFSRELLRLSLHGTLRPEKFRDLETRLAADDGGDAGPAV
ncbi:MAG TPA: TetR/AcrR family transcriptional regulator [Steroidobacteraceae bacterium]|jgi:AcrR family transcriptional regulator|nr:TetR/AcrR family transcriptional regulator [Steroidobacteraceae bacterium]